MSNKEIEEDAIEIVKEVERKRTGKEPKDVRKDKVGYDLKSDDRCIEVKGHSRSVSGFSSLNYSNIRSLEKNENYWLYSIQHIKSKPEISILNRTQLKEKAKKRRLWEIPIKKHEFNLL